LSFKKPKIVFSDFDGTMTDGHRLTRTFFDIVDLLNKNNVPLVIVTGRSRAWAHFLMSHFSEIMNAITEGGGMFHYRNERGRIAERVYIDHEEVERLEQVTRQLKLEFPNIELSLDSSARKTDRAIELYWLKEHASEHREIEDFFKQHNVNYSTSNVHLNFWCGEISKSVAMKKFLSEEMKITPEETVFFGDSLNDESAFKEFPHTVGVSNIKDVLERLEYKPSVILEGDDNIGPNGVNAYLKSLFQ
jgi:HAD superfamily hydrolase (TIGR01484 family)